MQDYHNWEAPILPPFRQIVVAIAVHVCSHCKAIESDTHPLVLPIACSLVHKYTWLLHHTSQAPGFGSGTSSSSEQVPKSDTGVACVSNRAPSGECTVADWDVAADTAAGHFEGWRHPDLSRPDLFLHNSSSSVPSGSDVRRSERGDGCPFQGYDGWVQDHHVYVHIWTVSLQICSNNLASPACSTCLSELRWRRRPSHC